VSLNVESLPEPGPSGPGGISDQLTLSGEVADPNIVTPETLAALNQPTMETATYVGPTGQVTDSYTGVSLWTLIQDAGLLTDPSIKNDLLRFGVVATGSDGYRAFISMGEIDPAFGHQPDLIAYADTGGQLGPGGPDGALRLVVPGDIAGGRYVSNLVSLQVIDAVGAPQS
jgi:DMSO/TMAO reductase YedYZ molybdopterin-dependent catalytic subunit